MKQDLQIILVEDNKADVFLFKNVLEDLNLMDRLVHFNYGQSFLDTIEKGELSPALNQIVFVDLNLPQKDGFQIIQEIIPLPDFVNAQFVLMSNLLPTKVKEATRQFPNLNCLEKNFEFDKFLHEVSGLIQSQLEKGGH